MNNEFNNNLNDVNNSFESGNQKQVSQDFNSKKSNNKILAILIIITIIGLVGCVFAFIPKGDNFEDYELSVDMVKFRDKIVYLKEGDELNVNAWNPPIKFILNEEELKLKKVPVLYNGVTLGTHVKDVIKKFNIKSGYAILNMEVSTEEQDGTTDIIEKSFENYNSIPKSFLDCAIIFGYNKIDGNWKMVEEDKILEADIVYYIDINGSSGEMYEKNEVIMFMIKYNK